jgi:hypothetical protein
LLLTRSLDNRLRPIVGNFGVELDRIDRAAAEIETVQRVTNIDQQCVRQQDDPTQLAAGWSTQELAYFCRVSNALCEAGFVVETDSGITDEGDPWFVFCDARSGEVVAHFARTSGTWAAFATFLNGTLAARAFPDLIERFLDRCPGRRRDRSPPAA